MLCPVSCVALSFCWREREDKRVSIFNLFGAKAVYVKRQASYFDSLDLLEINDVCCLLLSVVVVVVSCFSQTLHVFDDVRVSRGFLSPS
jgi:hypothetical protein